MTRARIPLPCFDRRLALGLAVGFASLVPSLAYARVDVAPYIEVDQTLIANLKGGDDGVLTYTTLAAGVDGGVTGRRAEAQMSLRYEHQFGWNRRTPDQDVFSGIARARVWAVRDVLSVDGSAFASRLRTDGIYGPNQSSVSFGGSTDDVYSFNIGPTLSTNVGDFQVGAAYRFGYTRLESNTRVNSGSNALRYGAFGESRFHSVTGSVGMRQGALPFGWTISAGYDVEDTSELKQHYSDKWARADVTMPITTTVALVGGIGYEKMRISQQSVLVDGAGAPVIDNSGNYVGDPTLPRQLAYETDGIIWDVGVLWRPSRRTSLEARVGRRYNSMHYVGTFSWQTGPNSSLQIAYFDTVDSFGRGLNNSLSGLPFAFTAMRNPLTGDLTGCLVGEAGTDCLNDALTGITGANYRRRGVAANYGFSRGRLNWGVGGGWNQRKFLTPRTGILAQINGLKDDYYYGLGYVGWKIDPNSTVAGGVYGGYFDSGATDLNLTNYGAYATYGRQFGRRISGQASVGVDATDGSQIEEIVTLLARIGVRYQF